MASVLIFEPKTEGHHIVYLRLFYEGLSSCFDRIIVCADFTNDEVVSEIDPILRSDVLRLCTGGLDRKQANTLAFVRSKEADFLVIPYLDDMLYDLAKYCFKSRSAGMPKVGGMIMGVKDLRWLRNMIREGHYMAGPKWLVSVVLLRLFFDSKHVAPTICNQDLAANSIKRALPKLGTKCSVAHDPWITAPNQSKQTVRESHSIPADRFVFIHIGSSVRRKGVDDMLIAYEKLLIEHAPGTFMLLRIGDNRSLSPEVSLLLNKLVDEGKAKVLDRFVDNNEFANLVGCSDCVVLPYRFHTDSSGVLAAAIGAGVGVIAADYGFIGQAVRKWKCGMLFEHNRLDSLAKVMSDFYVSGEDYAVPVTQRQSLSPKKFYKCIHEVYTREIQERRC